MTYDPFQIHSALGAYPGLTTPFQSPYMQLNPVAAFNPLTAAYPPIAGISPHHLQLSQILAARAGVPQLLAASPWTTGLNNPLLQNPLIAASLENPLVNPIFGQTQFGAQPYPFNPYIGQTVPQFGQMGSPHSQIPPQFGQIGSPYGQIPPQFGQIGSPLGQMGSPYGQLGSMLAPQSWVGQPGLYGSHTLGQVHPLVAQLAGRGFPGAGMFPTSL
jgi:hypothetical protein